MGPKLVSTKRNKNFRPPKGSRILGPFSSVEFELYPQKMWINLYIAVMTAGARSYITNLINYNIRDVYICTALF